MKVLICKNPRTTYSSPVPEVFYLTKLVRVVPVFVKTHGLLSRSFLRTWCEYPCLNHALLSQKKL